METMLTNTDMDGILDNDWFPCVLEHGIKGHAID
jgi:hypothetical protein